MIDFDQFQLCMEQARRIVAAYRSECPPGCDPQASAITTAQIVIAVAGAAYGAYSANQAGKAQQMQADYAAAQQERNARVQLYSMQAQAALQKQQADANLRLRQIEAQSRINNAKSQENAALAQEAVDRVNMRKRADAGAQLQSSQRAAIAASGIVESSGTPLDVLADTASKIQQDQEQQLYQSELQRRTLFSEAAMERLGGKMALAGATLDHNSGVAEASLRANAAQAEYAAGLRSADLTRLGGAYARSASQGQGIATLFSGVGAAANIYGDAQWRKKTAPGYTTS